MDNESEHLLAPRRAGSLRRELSLRNQQLAADCLHELTVSEVPSVIYAEDEAGFHGNFLPAAYRRILANEEWRKRLSKVYTGSRNVPRSNDRKRYELDCANSSDALLMNIFCYPGVMNRPQLCALLGVEKGVRPFFGYRPMTPLHHKKVDKTEIDLKIGDLLLEAKLTEGNFQSARPSLVHRYRDLDQVFDLDRLPMRQEKFLSYQLIRGVLAAEATGCSFGVLCDARRPDLIEDWYLILMAIQSAELRSRLRLFTWQELARLLSRTQQEFLCQKYGISGSSGSNG